MGTCSNENDITGNIWARGEFCIFYVRIYFQETLGKRKKLYLDQQDSVRIHKQMYTHLKYLPGTLVHHV